MDDVSLVIFTSEGREHLLSKTISSFYAASDYPFTKTILVVDGIVNPDVIATVKADIVLHQNLRLGYVKAIYNALKLIDTACFFWLEDDFIFNQPVPLPYMFNVVNSDNDWAGIFLSRVAPLTELTKKAHLFGDVYLPDFGFSVSPTLCRTSHVRDAFEAIIAYPKNETTKYVSFEPFLNEFFIAKKLRYAVLDPGAVAHVKHLSDLESTGREYHMINSLDFPVANKKTDYISGLQRERTITFYNKVGAFIKLYLAVVYLSINLFFSREAYDFAFRVYLAFLKRFKH